MRHSSVALRPAAPPRWRCRLTVVCFTSDGAAKVGWAAHLAAVTMATTASLSSASLSATAMQHFDIFRLAFSLSFFPLGRRICQSAHLVCAAFRPPRPAEYSVVHCTATGCADAILAGMADDMPSSAPLGPAARSYTVGSGKIFRAANGGLHPSTANLRGLQYVRRGGRQENDWSWGGPRPVVLAFLGNVATRKIGD